MKIENEFKFNIHFSKDGEKIEKLIVETLINYLKSDFKGMTF